MQNTNKARAEDSQAKATFCVVREMWDLNRGCSKQDVLQMLVSSNDAVKALSSCVDRISVQGSVLNLSKFLVLSKIGAGSLYGKCFLPTLHQFFDQNVLRLKYMVILILISCSHTSACKWFP